MSSSSHVVVIGAGVIGLSTAIKIQELGYRVTILAEYIPGDPKSIRYTSCWAGAHHVSPTHNAFIKDISMKTFDIMWEMSEPSHPASGCFMRIEQTEYYEEEREANALNVMPDFRVLDKSELVPGTVGGEAFKTLTIDIPTYLQWLMAKFLGNGGQLKRVQVQHIVQAAAGSHAREADAVVICTGLGSRFLGGVEDIGMYPIRGQTVLINAPWIKFGKTRSNLADDWTYIIPRRSGEVILGGTKLDNEWHPTPLPQITREIIARCLELCPELVPPNNRIEGKSPSVEDITPIIIEEGCGLRPARKGGLRIESDTLKLEGTGLKSREVPIVYNYGHAGFGYQSSWGSAIYAAQLLDKTLKGKMANEE